ncbi:MAG TPA: Gfo/Idh/MocA family oxidoreductase [Acetobacteraceae bacterium]|nr:Gfo/Idh/MocA family oxidoreductase [Acetobacteraceae bacterium]
MRSVLGVAVIGGGIGAAHLEEGWAVLPGQFRVLAMCDIDPGRRDKLAERFAIPRRTAEFADVLAMDDVDVVDICTPPSLHRAMIEQALAAGKHVICEKPLVGSLADADAVMAAERAATGRLMPIFQYRWGDGAQKAKRVFDAGLAGTPFATTVETHWTRDAAYYATPWRGRWDTELGGALTSQAIHAHDMLTWLMGPVARVFARTATRVNPIETEDCVSLSLLLASGALATSSVTLGSREEISRLRICCRNVTFESSLSPYSFGDDPWRVIPADDEVAARIEAATADYQPVGRRFAGQFAAFHAALEAGESMPVTSADARASLELLTAFYDSARRSADVKLPLAPDHPGYRGWRA